MIPKQIWKSYWYAVAYGYPGGIAEFVGIYYTTYRQEMRLAGITPEDVEDYLWSLH